MLPGQDPAGLCPHTEVPTPQPCAAPFCARGGEASRRGLGGGGPPRGPWPFVNRVGLGSPCVPPSPPWYISPQVRKSVAAPRSVLSFLTALGSCPSPHLAEGASPGRRGSGTGCPKPGLPGLSPRAPSSRPLTQKPSPKPLPQDPPSGTPPRDSPLSPGTYSTR